jgi:hypothetical protein
VELQLQDKVRLVVPLMEMLDLFIKALVVVVFL